MDFTVEVKDGKRIQVVLVDSEISAVKPVENKTTQRITFGMIRSGLNPDRITDCSICHPGDNDSLRRGRVLVLRRIIKFCLYWGDLTKQEAEKIWDGYFLATGEPNPRKDRA